MKVKVLVLSVITVITLGWVWVEDSNAKSTPTACQENEVRIKYRGKYSGCFVWSYLPESELKYAGRLADSVCKSGKGYVSPSLYIYPGGFDVLWGVGCYG